MLLTPTLLGIPINRKSKMAAVKRKFPYIGVYMVRNKNFNGYYHSIGHRQGKEM
jgi:hypothetical protein